MLIIKTMDEARKQVWRASEWKNTGEFYLMYLIATVGAGVHQTIDGKQVTVAPGQGTCAWSGCSLMPEFDSEGAAIAFANKHGLTLA
jgi:hypothetical protein